MSDKLTIEKLAGDQSGPPAADDYYPKEEWGGLPDWPTPRFQYRLITIFWTGWKHSQYDASIRGQRIACCSEEGPYFCVDLPSLKCFHFKRGERFTEAIPTEDNQKATLYAVGRKYLLEAGKQKMEQCIDEWLNTQSLPQSNI